MIFEGRVPDAIARIAAAAAFAGALSTGCADFSRGAAAMADDAGADLGAEGGGTAFGPVHALLLDGCQTCHVAGGQAGDTRFLLTMDAAVDYATVSPLVDAAAPAGSRLLAKMSGNGHGGGTVYAAGSPEYQTVLQWIQQGARP